jgi:hypothetical protein
VVPTRQPASHTGFLLRRCAHLCHGQGRILGAGLLEALHLGHLLDVQSVRVRVQVVAHKVHVVAPDPVSLHLRQRPGLACAHTTREARKEAALAGLPAAQLHDLGPGLRFLHDLGPALRFLHEFGPALVFHLVAVTQDCTVSSHA